MEEKEIQGKVDEACVCVWMCVCELEVATLNSSKARTATEPGQSWGLVSSLP